MIKLLKIAIKKSLIRLFDFKFGCLISKEKNDVIMLIGACLSYANYIGHSCLPISIFEKGKFFPKKEKILIKKILHKIYNIKNWKKKILEYKIIRKKKHNQPLIVYKNKIYLNKIWNIEKKIVNFIKQNNIKSKYFFKYTNKIKNILFHIPEKQQKIAISLAIIKKVSFIIGGPGTGKTTIITKILKIIKTLYKNLLNIKIVAYTGKATCRINEIIKENIDKNTKNIQITTLHNLIGIQKASEKTFFNKKNPILVDILIIDETSMIDLFTMNKLINALPKHTEIIFLGDVNQLSSIEIGSILKNICYNAKNQYTKKTKNLLEQITNCQVQIKNTEYKHITDCMYVLKKTYRFTQNKNIQEFSKSILNNNLNMIKKVLNNKFLNIKHYNINTNTEYKNMIKFIILMYSKYLKKLLIKNSKKEIIKLFNKYKILCVTRKGPLSIQEINQNIENNILVKYPIKKYWINDDFWYHGKPIMIRKNNKHLNLFNGQIGITLYNKEKTLEFFFLKNQKTIQNIPIHLLHQNEYEIAWSTTIHKSQGSEFEKIIIILPKTFISILNQELLYTAITRAKKDITIFSNKKIFLKTAQTKYIRYSGIKDLINQK